MTFSAALWEFSYNRSIGLSTLKRGLAYWYQGFEWAGPSITEQRLSVRMGV